MNRSIFIVNVWRGRASRGCRTNETQIGCIEECLVMLTNGVSRRERMNADLFWIRCVAVDYEKYVHACCTRNIFSIYDVVQKWSRVVGSDQ